MKRNLPFTLQHEIVPINLSVCFLSVSTSDLEISRVGPEHVTIKRFAHFVDRRLPPAPRVITKCTVLTSRGRKRQAMECEYLDYYYFAGSKPSAEGINIHLGWGS